MTATKPHVILIMTDQHRGDFLGCAGNPVIKTPNLDAIAADGVVFQRAYTSTPSCTPARAALLTGLSPWNHGMLGYGRVAPWYRYEMPKMLRDAGYYTVGVGKMHWFPQFWLHGFHRTIIDSSGRSETPGYVSDYRRWFRRVAPGKDPDATWKQAFGRDDAGWNDNRYADYALDEELHPTRWTGMTAVDQIKEHDPGEDPLFLKVSFARPHSPYDAPKRFVDMYRWEDMPDPVVGDWAAKFADFRKEEMKFNPAFGDFGIEHAKRARRHYMANITFIDEQIGLIIDALKEKGMYDDSLIIFISDHGDMLGDHYHWRKTYAYEGSARIPFILKWPAGWETKVPRGTTLPHLVELRDVLPTFLEAAGVLVPKDMDGKSLLGLIGWGGQREGEKGDRAGLAWREFLDLEHATTYDPHNYWVALTDGRQKYIFFRSTGEEQLFDLENDPGETHDLATREQNANDLARWRHRMVEHLRHRGDEWVKDDRLVSGARNVLYSPNYPRWQSVVESGRLLRGPDGALNLETGFSPGSQVQFNIPLAEILEEFTGTRIKLMVDRQDHGEGVLELNDGKFNDEGSVTLDFIPLAAGNGRVGAVSPPKRQSMEKLLDPLVGREISLVCLRFETSSGPGGALIVDVPG